MVLSYKTERLYIELHQKKHIKKTLEFYIRNAVALRKFEPKRTKEFYTLAYHKKQQKNDDKDMRNLKYLSFVLFKKDDKQKIIGYINFFDITFGVFQSCIVGYKIDKDERNNGYMQEGLNKMIDVIFNDLKLHRIEANVLPTNGPSITLLQKLGFEREGYGKKYLKINGEWQDHIHFTLLNEKGEKPFA